MLKENGDLISHAWLEQDNKIIFGEIKNLKEYVVIQTLK